MWETLEGMVREKAQEFIQQIMEEEVTELLGREKAEGRSTVDSAEGYRNGYGKPRRRSTSSKDKPSSTITLIPGCQALRSMSLSCRTLVLLW